MKKKILIGVLILVTQTAWLQTIVNGKVTDEMGAPLFGGTISLDGTSEGTLVDDNGSFSFETSKQLPFIISISYLGFEPKTIEVKSPGDIGTIVLYEGNALDEIIISASRRSEKVIEAVASVSTISTKIVENTPVNGDPSEYLRNVRGVNIVRSGTQFSNIELRGPVLVNESNTLILRDYAPLTTAADKRLTTAASALSPLDIARVEVVRGPSGALYGPNVTSGVVHYITKDAFKHPGTSALIAVGERNLITSRLRYAGNNGDKWGWKLLANYSQSNDFAVADDEAIANDGTTQVVVPQNFELLGGKTFENIDNLDDILLSSWNFEGSTEYRASDNLKFNYSFGLSRALTNFRNPISHIFLGTQRYEQQLRVSAGDFFASVYHRHQFGNQDKNGNVIDGLANHVFSLNYTAGAPNGTQLPAQQGAEEYIDISTQYNLDFNENFDAIIGADVKISPAFENPTIYGFSSGENPYNIYGGYLSIKYRFSDKLSLNAAGRADYFTAYEETAFSPRVGLVYNPSNDTGLRLSFSRSFEAQSKERTYLDFNLSSVLPPFFPATRIPGVAQEVTYNTPVTRFAFGDVVGGESFQLQNIINALAIAAGVTAPSVSGTTDPNLTTATFVGAGLGQSTGVPLSSLDQAGLEPPTLRTVNQIEVGYSTTINSKFKFNIDLYATIVENIQPAGEVSLTPGAQLDLAEVQSVIESQVPAGPDRDALITALNSNIIGPAPDGHLDSAPGYGVVMSDRAQQYGYVFDIGFPTYGNKNVSYFGVELDATYNVLPDLSVGMNYAHVSKTVWSAEDLGEINPEYAYYLNTPPNRINATINYYPEKGFYASLAMNYQDQYFGRQGDGRFFTGTNESRTIFDTRMGAKFGMKNSETKFDIGINVNNLFDEKYSHFVHLPQLRRFTSVSLQINL